MNKEIDKELAIEDLQKTDGLRELAKIKLDTMIEKSRENYIKSLEEKINKAISFIEYYKDTKLTKSEFSSYSYWLLEILKGDSNE